MRELRWPAAPPRDPVAVSSTAEPEAGRGFFGPKVRDGERVGRFDSAAANYLPPGLLQNSSVGGLYDNPVQIRNSFAQ